MIDFLYLAGNRPEFTDLSLKALRANTNWTLVNRAHVYFDGSLWPQPQGFDPLMWTMNDAYFGSPVDIMLDYIERGERAATTQPHHYAPVFAKIDNDVIVPPGWLDAAYEVMKWHPELDILGLEPALSRTKAPWASKDVPIPPEFIAAQCVRGNIPGQFPLGYARCDAVGGVGLFRRRAFRDRPRMVSHSKYGGFTDWQLASPDLVKGWIVPPLKLFLLDRMPIEPYASLSARYIHERQQRTWTPYTDTIVKELAGWWLEQ